MVVLPVCQKYFFSFFPEMTMIKGHVTLFKHTQLNPSNYYYQSRPVGHWGTNNTRSRDFLDKWSHDNWFPGLNSVVYTDETACIQQTAYLCNKNIVLRSNLKWTIKSSICLLHHYCYDSLKHGDYHTNIKSDSCEITLFKTLMLFQKTDMRESIDCMGKTIYVTIQ